MLRKKITKREKAVKKRQKQVKVKKPVKKKPAKKKIAKKTTRLGPALTQTSRDQTKKKVVRKKIAKRKQAKKKTSKKSLGQRIKVEKVADETVYGAVLESVNQEIDDGSFDIAGFETSPNENIQFAVLNIEETQPETVDHLTLRQKNILMYIAITCIMVVIVSFWFVGIKNSLGQNLVPDFFNINQENNEQRVEESFEDVRSEFLNLTNILDQQGQEANELIDQAKDKIAEEQLKQEIADNMKEKLESFQLESNLLQNENLNIN